MSQYLMAGQLSELDRLQLQARVWEPAGGRLLDEVGSGTGRRALDVGCGCLGWLRLLSKWVGPDGEVVGSDIDERLLGAAEAFVAAEGLSNVRVVRDDLFASELARSSFDLVHARFQIAPLGRPDEQLARYRELTARGGRLVLEDPDSASWRYNPPAPSLERLIDLILEAFRAAGGDFDSGRHEAGQLRDLDLNPNVRAEILALPPGHPYMALPLQFASSLEKRLLDLVSATELTMLRTGAKAELAEPRRWAMTFTLVQTWATVF